MRTLIPIDPVTRIEGHLKVEIEVDTIKGVQQVVEARATGTLFRGFEQILIGRKPSDAPHITQRICGVCPVPHAMASVMALERARGIAPPRNAVLERNIVLGANFLDSHILHFYHLALMDYVDGPKMPPWQPSWNVDKRLDQPESDELVAHYVAAVDMRRKAHELGAIFGGRMPHVPTFIPGGITAVPKATAITKLNTYMNEMIPWIRDVYIPDVQRIAARYKDYYEIGGGFKNLMSYGVFDQDGTGANMLLRAGIMPNATTTPAPLDTTRITEHVRYSWYQPTDDKKNPAVGTTNAVYPKTDAYSWIKAPRYVEKPYECGPLPRMWATGQYQNGVSVMDRHLARAYEALRIAQAMQSWANSITVGQSVYTSATDIVNGTGVGLTEAPRGAIGHWVNVQNSVISRYQIITPTCWNCSPRDGKRQRGPLEEALIGTPIEDDTQPIEVLRIIHSFDPCLGCAVHVMRPDSTEVVAKYVDGAFVAG